MLQKLKQEYLDRIKDDVVLCAMIAKLFDRSVLTIQRWADAGELKLTLPAVQEIIRKHEVLAEDTELLEVVNEDANAHS